MRSNCKPTGRELLHKLAIVMGLLLFSMLLHKGITDISVIAEKYSGRQFWVAMGRYFIGNLAGGKAAADL